VLDTTMLGLYAAGGISLGGNVACIASLDNYMLLLDVSDPAHPREVGRYTAPGGGMDAVMNAESVAFVPAYSYTHDTVLHAVDISDPANPVVVGAVGGWEGPKAMVLRDSFLYAAEPYRFEVFNVANPRQPVWMGRCDLPTSSSGISIQDTLVYLAPNIYVINVARPAQPVLVGQTSSNCNDVAVLDTFCYVAHAYESLKVYSVANPAVPRRLSSTWVPGQAYTVTVRDSYVHLGCNDFRVFDIGNPASPLLTGYYATPYRTRSLDFDSLYVYVACYLAGVEILELLPVGLAEPGERLRCPTGASLSLSPNPVGDYARLSWSGSEVLKRITVRNAAGRTVLMKTVEPAAERRQERLGLSHIRPGVYFVEVDLGKKTASAKLVKR
jgi:hypothetical protein